MKLIEGMALSSLCDYSFGDQASEVFKTPNRFIKFANESNLEFLNKIKEISKSRNYMTLFIDNIRLYRRNMGQLADQAWIDYLFKYNDLLKLCAIISNMNFIIFTGLEDTPIDDQIKYKIPNNVLSINAVNALYHDNKVIPMPYGLQRKLYDDDDRLNIMESSLRLSNRIKPKNLLYVNHTVESNPKERAGINELFENKSWAKVIKERLNYQGFLLNILHHKFMICPIGHAIDCHRYWEVLYLRRVPILKKHPYLEVLFKDLPVIFVEDYKEINKSFLLDHDYLFTELQSHSLQNLDLEFILQDRIKRSFANLTT